MISAKIAFENNPVLARTLNHFMQTLSTMKRLIIPITIAAFLPAFAFAQSTANSATTTTTDLRKITNNAFKRGETLKYRLHYGAIDAGEADISIDNTTKMIKDRPTYHAVGVGYSKGAFDWFYKVRDRYESYIDEDALVPWIFMRRTDEGGFKIKQDQMYDQENGKVLSNGKSFDIPKYMQDMISSFYYARTIDFSKAKIGDIFTVPTFVDDEAWQLKIKYLGKETIDSDLGNVNCLKFCPVIQKGRVFKHEDDLNVWISDDPYHVPIRAQAQILVGSVKMDIMSADGLPGKINLSK